MEHITNGFLAKPLVMFEAFASPQAGRALHRVAETLMSAPLLVHRFGIALTERRVRTAVLA